MPVGMRWTSMKLEVWNYEASRWLRVTEVDSHKGVVKSRNGMISYQQPLKPAQFRYKNQYHEGILHGDGTEDHSE